MSPASGPQAYVEDLKGGIFLREIEALRGQDLPLTRLIMRIDRFVVGDAFSRSGEDLSWSSQVAFMIPACGMRPRCARERSISLNAEKVSDPERAQIFLSSDPAGPVEA